MTDLAHLFDSPDSLALYRVKRERDEARQALRALWGDMRDIDKHHTPQALVALIKHVLGES